MQELCLGCMNPAADTDVCPHCGYVKGTPAKEPYHIPPGTMLRKYLIGKVLGYGGFGVTYLGYDTQFKIKVAIKEYLPGELATRMPGETQVTIYSGEKTQMFETGREKFLDEARRLAKFTAEPGVVSIQDEFDENGTCYIVMEFLEGETLKQKLAREGKLSVEEAITLITPILDALTAVHEKGIIHRDISPDNIFLTTDGRIKLLDFGAARYAGSNQSKSLSVILKPGYAPEEQYRSRGDQGPWSDVYACAATIYKMITGVTPEDAMERTLKDELKPPSKQGVKISKNIETAIMNALNIYKDNRTQSAQEFKEQLTGAVNVTRLRNTHKLMDIGSWKTGHKVALAAILCLLTVGVVLYAVLRPTPPPPPPPEPSADLTQVPDVISMAEEIAKSAVDQAALIPMIINGDYSDSIEVGTIVNQDIPAGRLIPRDSYLKLVMSLGRHLIELKDVTGMERDDAYKELTELGFTVKMEQEYSVYAKGTICRQDPEPGLYVTGKEVLIVESLGIEYDPTKIVKLEDYVGKPIDEVEKTLQDIGITIRKENVYSSEAKGTIIKQDLAAGKEVPQGTEIKLTVSLGDKTVLLGNYYAWDLTKATNELKKLGIKNIRWEYVDNELYAKDLILSQEPEAGTAILAETATVVFKVSKGRGQRDVPSVSGMTEADARKALKDAEFQVSVTEAYSDTVPAGKIIRQDYQNEKAYIGQTIEIVVSKGRASILPTGLRLNMSSVTMYYPSSTKVNITGVISPSNAEDKQIHWESSNQNIVRITGGSNSSSTDGGCIITAFGTGSAVITGRTNSGNITATCRVTVEDRKLTRIKIENPASVTEFYQGDVLNTSGLTLSATYNSGESETIRSGFSGSPTKLEKVGDQTVTISYGGLTDSYSVKVIPPIMKEIRVAQEPTKIKYQTGDTLDTRGLILEAQFRDKTETITSGYSCSPNLLNTEGKQLITVSYGGLTTSFTVEVKPPTVKAFEFDQMPHKLEYVQYETLNTNGLRLHVYYENGSETFVSTGFNASVSRLDQIGTVPVTITYGGKNRAFTVTVVPREVKTIDIKTEAKTKTFYLNDTLDTDGLKLTATYNDGSEATILGGFNCTPKKLTVLGTQTITVSYEGATTTYDVEVIKEKKLTDISVKTMPDRTVFFEDESIDLSGMVLEASYSDGSTEEITSGYSHYTSGSGTQRTLTVQYPERNITKEDTISITVLEAIKEPDGDDYDDPTLVAERTCGKPGEIVPFRLFLFHNPGYSGATITLLLPESFSPDKDSSGEIRYEANEAGSKPMWNFIQNGSVLGIGGVGSSQETDNGAVLTIYLKIPENAEPGREYPIEIRSSSLSFYDQNGSTFNVDDVIGYIVVY